MRFCRYPLPVFLILNLQFYKDHGFSEHFVILDRRTLDVQFTKASFEGLMLKEKTAFYQCELQANVDTVDEGAVLIVDKYYEFISKKDGD